MIVLYNLSLTSSLGSVEVCRFFPACTSKLQMIWYGMVWYGNTLFNDAGPDSNLLISTGGVKTLTIYKKGKKKEEIFTCEYFWCDHNYHLAIISSNNILKLVDRFGYLCVKREAIPQFSPTIIETLFEELSIWFRKG